MELSVSLIENWCVQLKRDPKYIDLEVLRNVIRMCHKIETEKKPDSYDSEIIDSVTKLSEILEHLLTTGIGTVEGQTLCSSAYCALFVILSEEYCEICLRNLNTKLTCYLLQQMNQMENDLSNIIVISKSIEDRKFESQMTTLISGIFQTNLLNKSYLPENSRSRQLSEDIMLISFKISTNACLTYSSSTFMHFRNLHSIILKMVDWNCCNKVIGDFQNVLFYVIFNNWENVLSGIREINQKIWKLFLSILNKNTSKNPDLFDSITACILKFPWNKAKYFVLSEIIPHLKLDILEILANHPIYLNGLEYSLKHSSLISAGSDMYKTILEYFKSFNDWTDTFLPLFKEYLGSDSFVGKNNILNYWMPATIKKYPELIECLLEYYFTKAVEQNDMFSLLGVIRLGRKLGFIWNDWDTTHNTKFDLKKYIDLGLININENVRSQAFQIVCETQKNIVPTPDEFHKVQIFLESNVNNDLTSFRHSTLNSFTIFLTRVRDSCLGLLKNRDLDIVPIARSLNEIGDFFVWIHGFLIKNLEQGNYQRKFLSLQMYDVILRYLCGGYNDKANIQKSLCRKGNLRDQAWKVLAFLESRNKWLFHNQYSVKVLTSCISDSTNDIRETAVDILVQYFSENKIFLKSKKEHFVHGIISCKSKLFYEVECGCLMFKIVACLNKSTLIRSEALKRLIHPFGISEYLLNRATEQLTYQKKDILLSIYDNQPLHGMISAINMYIKHSDDRLTFSFMTSVRELLTTIINYFIKILACKSENSNLDVPPSFAEMGESIEHIIKSSEYKEKQQPENTQHLSNAHQLILNNIWLNLKACCELSSTLIILQSNNLPTVDIRTLLDISISVLTRCRHKGAIESAGVTLGQSVKHLTSLKKPVFNQMISDILKEFLTQSTSEKLHGVSVTRKSAGLTILVHRIVSNDSQSGKPLFYLTMDLLLRVLSRPESRKRLGSSQVESVEAQPSQTAQIEDKEDCTSNRHPEENVEEQASSSGIQINIIEPNEEEKVHEEKVQETGANPLQPSQVEAHTSNSGQFEIQPNTSKEEQISKSLESDVQPSSSLEVHTSKDRPLSEDFANESDVPLARALHLLCRTVCESSLASYVIQFAPQLATVCFKHLTDEQWQVRNAALQLYGALVPKLIGQKKSQGDETFTKSPVSPDELFSHVPSLWNFIKSSLKTASITDNAITSHSTIVPILSLLSSMANRYSLNNFCSAETRKFGINVANLEDIFPNLIVLLGSPIYNIRNISACIIASSFDFPIFFDHWTRKKDTISKENQIHGYLLALKEYVLYFNTYKKYLFNSKQSDEVSDSLKTITTDLKNIINGKKTSYIVKALHLEIEQLLNKEKMDFCKSLEEAFDVVKSYGDNVNLQVGIHTWLQVYVTYAVLNCSEDELLSVLKTCIDDNSSVLIDINYWPTVRDRIDQLLAAKYDNFQDIFEYFIILSSEKQECVGKIIYEILYLISSRSESVSYCGSLGRIYCNINIEECMIAYEHGYLLPLVCSMAFDKEISISNLDLHMELSKVCKQLSKPERFEVAYRKMAAVSMKHLVKLLHYYVEKKVVNSPVNEIIGNILITSLWLLQDEDASVRTECSKMQLKLQDNQIKVHPNVHINTILNLRNILRLFCEAKTHALNFLQNLSKELSKSHAKKNSKDLQNPFDHNTQNIYWEPIILYKRVSSLIERLNRRN